MALSAAVLLAGALAYTSFSASTEARTPSQLLASNLAPGKTYQLTGKVGTSSPFLASSATFKSVTVFLRHRRLQVECAISQPASLRNAQSKAP